MEVFLQKNKKNILKEINIIGNKYGFKQTAFDSFYSILNTNYKIQEIDYFDPIVSTFANNNGESIVMTMLKTTNKQLDEIETQLNAINDKSFSFDAGTINRSTISTL